MALGTPCVLMIFPTLFEVTAITQQMLLFLVIAEICCLMAVLALEEIRRMLLQPKPVSKTQSHNLQIYLSQTP